MTPEKIRKHALRHIVLRRAARYNREQHSKCIGYVLHLLKEIDVLRKELHYTKEQIDVSVERIDKHFKKEIL